MVRRLKLEEPLSRLAVWSRRLALFALAVAFIAVALTRGGLIETAPGFVAFGGALLLAAIAILLGLAAFVVIWFKGNPGLGRAVAGVALGAALLAYPTSIAMQSYDIPFIADVTTDTANPPRFELIARLRPAGANPIAYPGAEAARKQRTGYPDIAPLALAAAPLDAYNAALAVMTRRRWRVVNARAPQAGRRDGHIEAVALTLLMGFRDDVVVRIRGTNEGVIVDVRSASRYGGFDFGANARRIRSLLQEIEEEVSAQPPASQ